MEEEEPKDLAVEEEQPQQEELADNPPIAPIQMLLKTNCFVDRYFKRYYTDEKAPIQQYLYLHSNGLAIIGVTRLAISPLEKSKISISYSCLTNNIADIVKGKKKSNNQCYLEGGVRISPNTKIA
jgi:hypothetical protein